MGESKHPKRVRNPIYRVSSLVCETPTLQPTFLMVQLSDAFSKAQASNEDSLHPQDAERQQLEALWHSGRLQRHLDALERFYSTKQHEFKELLKTTDDSDELVEVAKLLVVQNGIVDQLTETLDQIKEIESEIWIQGERGNYDRDQIAVEWTERYAASWREWRIKEYLYAVERMESRLGEFAQIAS